MILSVVVTLVLALHYLSAQAPLDKHFQAREEAIVAAIKAKQYDKFQDMHDPAFTSVYGSGIEGGAPVVEAVKKVTVRGADFSDFTAHQLDQSIVRDVQGEVPWVHGRPGRLGRVLGKQRVA